MRRNLTPQRTPQQVQRRGDAAVAGSGRNHKVHGPKGRPDRTPGYKALMALSANMAKPPESFADDKFYRVQLTKSVELGGHWLRPSADVIVKGSFANQIMHLISGAQEVRPLG